MIDVRKSFTLHAIFGFIFLVSGLVVNFLQAINYVVFYHTNRKQYRKLNHFLLYTSWSQLVAVFEWWTNSSCNLYGTEEDLKKFGTEHSILIMNHRYETDWLICWVIFLKLGMLEAVKSFAKKSLKYVPVVGWSWAFNEIVFLERNWDKDKQTLSVKLDNLMDYDDPVVLLIFAEGTRFTTEKHEASLKFARDKGLPQFKYHLLPRLKGFNFSVTHLKSKIKAVYDVQLAFPNDAHLSFNDLLNGRKLVGDIHVRRIPINEVPTGSNDETTQFLYQLYQEKDKLMENYLKTSVFPGKCVKLKRSPLTLINSLFWVIVIGVPLISTIYKLLFSGNPWVVALTVTVIVLVLLVIYMMIGATKATKGSSYGKTSSSSKQK